MAFICPRCLHEFDEFEVEEDIAWGSLPHEKGTIECTSSGCQGRARHIDDVFVPLIKLLTKKGYYTRDSGSEVDLTIYPHYNSEVRCFIEFDKCVKSRDLKTIPEGFVKVREKGRVILKKTFDPNISEVELAKQFLMGIIKLIKWAETLEVRNENA